jgi:pyridoxal phosphate enzyme (YggS family)
VSDATAPDVAARVASVRARVDAAARAAGRAPDAIRLVAATKTQSVEAVRAVLAAGVVDVGENRAQELVAKAPALEDAAPTWHFIGRLQRNKINQLAPWVRWWQSVDRTEVVDALATRVPGAHVLLEVNVAGEAQKGGCTVTETPDLVDRARAAGLVPLGLMTVAPAAGDPRPVFAALRGLAERVELTELSMGMSSDFEAAIAEGATVVRVGTALFGPRPPAGGTATAGIPPN